MTTWRRSACATRSDTPATLRSAFSAREPAHLVLTSVLVVVMLFDLGRTAARRQKPAAGQEQVTTPAAHEANPDGGTVDAEGGYWSAECMLRLPARPRLLPVDLFILLAVLAHHSRLAAARRRQRKGGAVGRRSPIDGRPAARPQRHQLHVRRRRPRHAVHHDGRAQGPESFAELGRAIRGQGWGGGAAGTVLHPVANAGATGHTKKG